MTITKKQLTEYFEYLDELRKSGETNMFGAAEYLEAEFHLNRRVAKAVLTSWMRSFGHGTASAAERAQRAYSQEG